MSAKKLTQIDKETLNGQTELTEIDLSLNELTQIDKGTFNGLTNLTEILLHKNLFYKNSLELFLEDSVRFISFKNSYTNNISNIIKFSDIRDIFNLSLFILINKLYLVNNTFSIRIKVILFH